MSENLYKTSNLHLSLPQMLDIAFGIPEGKNMNFNIFHHFLQILLHLHNLNSTKVEYRGENAEIMKKMMSVIETEANPVFTEYKANDYDYYSEERNNESNSKHIKIDVYIDDIYCTIFKSNEQDAYKYSNGKASAVAHRVKKDNKVEREAGGGDEEAIQTNEPPSEAEDNITTFSKADNISEDENTTIEKMNDAASINNNQIELQKGSLDFNTPNGEFATITDTLTDVKKEICNLREKIFEIYKEQGNNDRNRKDTKSCNVTSKNIGDDKYYIIKQKPSNIKPSSCTELISIVETTLTNSINCMEKRLQSFEQYVQCSLNNINDIISQMKNEDDPLKLIKAVQRDIEELRNVILDLQKSQDAKDSENKVLEEKIEMLKIIKANKEDVEDALADKADYCALNQKVSHEQFNAVCDDLSRILNDAIARINQLDSNYEKSLYELRQEIEEKLDNLGIPVFKDFVNTELQALKQRLQALSAIKQEQDAAGARKMLRNLHCISCDKDAFMQKNLKMITNTQPFPNRCSIKPYLAFKMSEVRAGRKNPAQMAQIAERTAKANGGDCPEAASRVQFCNRYCGGSHTAINPQQRVTSLHRAATRNCDGYPEEKSPRIVEGIIEGTDGRTYKGRTLVE